MCIKRKYGKANNQNREDEPGKLYIRWLDLIPFFRDFLFDVLQLHFEKRGQKLKQKKIFILSLGVSIGLDVISIEISISTPKKYQSWRSRKSRRFSKVSLDDREISVEIEISRFSLDELSQGLTF